jgi:hypothetical protein
VTSHWVVAATVVFALATFSCGARRDVAAPPPAYERWSLPEWNPEEDPDATLDPEVDLAGMEGEWVVDPEEDSPSAAGDDTSKGGEASPSTPSEDDPEQDAGPRDTAPEDAAPKDSAHEAGAAAPTGGEATGGSGDKSP